MLGHEHKDEVSQKRGTQAPDEMVQDPCCKVYVPMSRAVRVYSGGQTIYFCSEDCAKRHAEGRCG